MARSGSQFTVSLLTVLTLASVTDDWRITEHSPNVALQLANQWAIAVNAQARRIQNPDNTQERIPDAYIQVLALRNLLRAAELAKKTVPSRAATDAIKKAIRAFLDAVIVIGTISNQDNALERARNVVEHFDEYYRGTGKQQKQDQADKTLEDLAQDYRIDFEPPVDRPQLRVGPVRPAEALFTIDLATTAPHAARQLVDAVHAAIVQDQTPNANG